jgi:hypothetical protein
MKNPTEQRTHCRGLEELQLRHCGVFGQSTHV